MSEPVQCPYLSSPCGSERLYAGCLFQRASVVPEPVSYTHLDVYKRQFYRIKKRDEVYDMGYEDYFYSGNLCFLEWPELIEDLLPEDCTKVTLTVEEDGTRSVEW